MVQGKPATMNKSLRHKIMTYIRHSYRKPHAPRDEHAEHEEGCTALCCAHAGQSANIVRIEGDLTQAARLRDLGVREGVEVTVVCDGDPLIVKVEDARFGIGRSAAMNVLCTLHESECKRPSTS